MLGCALDLRGTVGFFASSTESVTVTGDKDGMFVYYSFPLRVGSDAIQYRFEGARKRTEKRPQITRLDAVIRLSLSYGQPEPSGHVHVVHGFLNSMLANLDHHT